MSEYSNNPSPKAAYRDIKAYSIKIPKGLRNLLNDLTKEILCKAPSDVAQEHDVIKLCAEFLDRRLEERQPSEVDEDNLDDLDEDSSRIYSCRSSSRQGRRRRRGRSSVTMADAETSTAASDSERRTKDATGTAAAAASVPAEEQADEQKFSREGTFHPCDSDSGFETTTTGPCASSLSNFNTCDFDDSLSLESALQRLSDATMLPTESLASAPLPLSAGGDGSSGDVASLRRIQQQGNGSSFSEDDEDEDVAGEGEAARRKKVSPDARKRRKDGGGGSNGVGGPAAHCCKPRDRRSSNDSGSSSRIHCLELEIEMHDKRQGHSHFFPAHLAKIGLLVTDSRVDILTEDEVVDQILENVSMTLIPIQIVARDDRLSPPLDLSQTCLLQQAIQWPPLLLPSTDTRTVPNSSLESNRSLAPIQVTLPDARPRIGAHTVKETSTIFVQTESVSVVDRSAGEDWGNVASADRGSQTDAPRKTSTTSVGQQTTTTTEPPICHGERVAEKEEEEEATLQKQQSLVESTRRRLSEKEDAQNHAVTQTDNSKLSERGVQTEPPPSPPPLSVQDDVVARVLLEHAGTVFLPPDPRRSVNYLDLSKIGEEGETPASEEIWLAVDDEEKGFLSSSTEDDAQSMSSVDAEAENNNNDDNDALTSATAMASSRREIREASVEVRRGSGGDAATTLLPEDEGGGNEDEVTARMLHGVIAEELTPIQDTLSVTEKSMVGLTEKLERMEIVLNELVSRVRLSSPPTMTMMSTQQQQLEADDAQQQQQQGQQSRLDSIVAKMETLSEELASVDCVRQLRSDNDHLRKDLDCYRKRERSLLSQMEEMETRVRKFRPGHHMSRVGSGGSSSGGGSVESESGPDMLPPIAPSISKCALSLSMENELLHVTETIEPLRLPLHPKEKTHTRTTMLPRRRSAGLTTKQQVPLLDQDTIQTEIQIARSDNVILRQDLQTFRERESQLVRRNKQLEDRLIVQRRNKHKTTTGAASLQATEVDSRRIVSLPAAHVPNAATADTPQIAAVNVDSSKSTAIDDADVDDNNDDDSNSLGDPKIVSDQAVGAKKPKDNCGKDQVMTQPKPSEVKKDSLPKMKMTGKQQHKEVRKNGTKGNNNSSLSVAKPSKSSKLGESSQDLGTIVEVEELKKSSLDANEDWRVTITSKQELEFLSISAGEVVISPRSPEPPPLNADEQQEPDPPLPVPRPHSPPFSMPTVIKPEVEAPESCPPKVTVTTATKIKGPKVRPVKVMKKQISPPSLLPVQKHAFSSQSDARNDPIPKPSQFPAARPPRDYKPGRAIPYVSTMHASSVASTISKTEAQNDDPSKNDTVTTNTTNNSRQESIHQSGDVIHMYIKEEAQEANLEGIPHLYQVRESPDGANSSRASNATTNIVELIEEEDTGDTEDGGGGKDIMMEFVLLSEQRRRQSRKQGGGGKFHTRRSRLSDKNLDEIFPNRKRPAVIRRPKKQRSRSLSGDDAAAISNLLSSSSSSRFSTKKHHFRSVERLSNLSAFDEERIVWVKNLEDDIALEDERRNRCLIRQAAAEIALEEMVVQSPSSSSSSSSSPPPPTTSLSTTDTSSATRTVIEAPKVVKKVEIEKDVKEEEEKSRPQRRHWDVGKVDGTEYKQKEESPEMPVKMAKKRLKDHHHHHLQQQQQQQQQQPLSVECFMVSRGWQLDQGRLLRALDRIKCATFARIQITATMNRVVENVRPHLDAVILHVGTQDLMDAVHSVGDSLVAGSVATVISRQILKLAGQNRACQFLVSLPMPRYPGPEGSSLRQQEEIFRRYSEMRRTFNSSLRANCSSHENVHCIDNENLSAEDEQQQAKYFSDNGQLNPAGIRKLARNWESVLRRISHTADGQVLVQWSSESSSSAGGSAASTSGGGGGGNATSGSAS